MKHLYLLLIIGFILQSFFMYKQYKIISLNYATLVKKYHGREDYFLGYGRQRTTFRNLRPGEIALVVLSSEDNIVEVLMLKGYTIFSKFKKIKELEGVNVNDLANLDINNSIRLAIENIENIK